MHSQQYMKKILSVDLNWLASLHSILMFNNFTLFTSHIMIIQRNLSAE